jgi:hypothetical protein
MRSACQTAADHLVSRVAWISLLHTFLIRHCIPPLHFPYTKINLVLSIASVPVYNFEQILSQSADYYDMGLLRTVEVACCQEKLRACNDDRQGADHDIDPCVT